MALAIRGELSAAELRAYARRAPSPRAAARAYALANALEGMIWAEAARLAGMEQQGCWNAVLRYTSCASSLSASADAINRLASAGYCTAWASRGRRPSQQPPH